MNDVVPETNGNVLQSFFFPQRNYLKERNQIINRIYHNDQFR